MSGYRVVRLDDHDRATFESGSELLDRYFRQQAGQDVKRRVASCFIALASDGAIAGFYTIAAASLPIADLPSERARKLPRYPIIPAILLGRLAVARAHQGKGLGAALVADVLQRSLRSDVADYAIMVDAKDEDAARFYIRFGFERLAGDARRLMLPLGKP